MNIKSLLPYLAVFVLGVLVGQSVCQKKESDVIPLKPVNPVIDTVYLDTTETEYIPDLDLTLTPDIPFGEILIRTKIQPFTIKYTAPDGTEYKQGGRSETVYRGTIYSHKITLDQSPVVITVPKPGKQWVDPYCYGAVYVDLDRTFYTETEIGVIFWDRLALFGRARADHELHTEVVAGIKIYLF